MKAITRERLQGSRSRPKIVVDARRDGFFGRVSDRVAPFEAQSASQVHFTDDAFAKALDCLLNRGRGANLRAMLHHAIVFFRRANELAAFPEVVRAGLLDIDILAGLASPDGHQRMPMIWCGKRDRIN